jgi:CBS domain-containing protein
LGLDLVPVTRAKIGRGNASRFLEQQGRTMKVQDIMTTAPLTCAPETNLAEVAHRMWQADSGIIPITDADGKVLGVITDRDICMAASTRDQAPSYIRAAALVRQGAVCCGVGDDVRTALGVMRDHRVRRLPVIGADGVLHGVVSLNDIILELKTSNSSALLEVIEAMKAICAHHHVPAPVRGRLQRAPAKKPKVSRTSAAKVSA